MPILHDIIQEFAYYIIHRWLQRFALNLLGLWRPLSLPGRGDECFCLLMSMKEEYKHTQAKKLTSSPFTGDTGKIWEEYGGRFGVTWRNSLLPAQTILLTCSTNPIGIGFKRNSNKKSPSPLFPTTHTPSSPTEPDRATWPRSGKEVISATDKCGCIPNKVQSKHNLR